MTAFWILAPVMVLAGAVGVLMFAGVIEPDTALSGLSSSAPATTNRPARTAGSPSSDIATQSAAFTFFIFR